MYHDEHQLNINTSFPSMGALTDYPRGETYTPLMDSLSSIDPSSGVFLESQQAKNWMTEPAPSTITQPGRPNSGYRDIRPRPPHIPALAVPPVDANRKCGQEKHPKRQRQLDYEQVQRTTKKARPAGCEADEMTNQPMRNDEMRFVWL
jgi:hypothetical protein